MSHENDELRTIKKLLTEDRAIAFRSTLKRITGSYCAALMLAQLMFWHPKASGEWLYKTDAEMGEEICASEDELQTARSRLTKLGFIETKRIGLPAKMHYRVNFEAIVKAISPADEGENRPEETPSVPENPRNLLPEIPGTSSGGHSATSSGEPPELSYTEMTTEMTTSADARALVPPGEGDGKRTRRDALDIQMSFDTLKAQGRAEGRDRSAAAHPMAGRWPHLVDHCRAFEAASGLSAADLTRSQLAKWAKDLEGHAQAGLVADDERRLYGMARAEKWKVYSPGSMDSLIATMRKGAATHAVEQPARPLY